MAGKTIIQGRTARDQINKGIQLACSAVASTFGPRGRTVSYTKGTNTVTTKDGITVLKILSFSDEAQDTGLKLLKEAADKANMHSGDGSTTTTILTAALCAQANKLLTQGININDLRTAFRKARDAVLEALPSFKKDVDSADVLRAIALVSANGDEEIAGFVSDAFASIGDGGIVSYADSMSRNGKTVLDVSQGLQIDKGFISSKCVNTTNGQAILSGGDVQVILFKDVVEDVEAFSFLAKSLGYEPKALVVAPEYGDEVRAFYTKNLADKGIILITAPGISQESITANIVDIAVVTNGQVVGIDVPTIAEYDPKKHAGHCESVTVTNNSTVITNPSTDQETFKKHIEQLKSLTEEGDCIHGKSQFQIDSLKERIAKLTGGVATIYIGALTSVELSEKKDRYDDAINAVRNALASGILPGGGTALLRISYGLKAPEDLSIPQKTAWDAYMAALRVLTKRLIFSANETVETIVPAILADSAKTLGFDARDGEVADLVKKGIVDPYEVVKNSVVYSSSMAEQFMSIDTIVVSDVKNLSIEPLDETVDPGRMFLGGE